MSENQKYYYIKLKDHYFEQDNTNKEAADILGVSNVTLIEMIKRAGIELKGKGYPNNYEIV